MKYCTAFYKPKLKISQQSGRAYAQEPLQATEWAMRSLIGLHNSLPHRAEGQVDACAGA